jgi:hypothetical protein
MLHILIGLPLFMAVTSLGENKSRYADFYEVARTAPRYEVTGVVERTGRRWKSYRMVVTRGDESLMFFCSPTLPYGCFDGLREPFRGTVRLFDYRGRPIVLAIRREDGSYVGGHRSDGRYVATERDHLNDIRIAAERYGRDSFWASQWRTFQTSSIFAIGGALFLFWIRRSIARQQAKKSATA